VLGAALLAAGGVAALASALVAGHGGGGGPVAVRSTRRITFEPGCEVDPSLAPAGRTAVYAGLADGD